MGGEGEKVRREVKGSKDSNAQVHGRHWVGKMNFYFLLFASRTYIYSPFRYELGINISFENS